MSREVNKIGVEGKDSWNLDYTKKQTEALRSNDAEAKRAQETLQHDVANHAQAPAAQKPASNLPANLRPSVQTENANNKTPASAPNTSSGAASQPEKDPRAATPERAAQVAQANTAFLGARDAAKLLNNLGSSQKVEAPKAELSPHGTQVATATPRAVAGKAGPAGTEVKQFNSAYAPNTSSGATNPSAKQNLQRVVREQGKQNQVDDHAAEHLTTDPQHAEQVASALVHGEKPVFAEHPRAEGSKKKDRKADKEEKRTGASTEGTRTAKAKTDLEGMLAGGGSDTSDSGDNESQEYGHIVEMLVSKMAAAFPDETDFLKVFSVDAINAQGELAAAYLQKAQQLRHEVIKDLGTRLNMVASENAALDAALRPLRERAEGLKTSDFLNDVNGIGILG